LGEWTLKLIVCCMLLGSIVTSFCAGATWSRMQTAGIVLAEARALHEQAVEDDRQSRQILQRLQGQKQNNHGSRDAGQMSSL